MNILITGGAGYLGHDIVQALNRMNEVTEITIYDSLYRENLQYFFSDAKLPKVKFIKGDILNEYLLKEACENQDIIIHLAAFVDYPYSYKDSFHYEQINQYGTGILANILSHNKPKKIIYANSGAVYGFQDANEDTEPIPENAYGQSKLEGEKFLQNLIQTSEVYCLRIGNVFGYNPVFRYDSVINHFITNSLLYNKIQIIGNGEQKRPFICINYVTQYVQDIILDHKKEKLVNLVQDSISINDILDLLKNISPDLEFTYVNPSVRTKGYTMSSKFYSIEETLNSSIEKTYQEFKQNFRLCQYRN